MLWSGSNVSISSGKRTCEWALTFFPRTLHPASFACHSRVTLLNIPYASVKSNCAHPPQLHCGASAYHVGPWEGVSASFAWPGARAFAYPGASPELLVCSQSLYFLFKVRWARLIKYKPRGIYYRQRKRVGVEEETRSRKQRLCTVYRPFDTHVVSYPIITKHGGFYRKHKQIGRLVHLSRMRKTWGVWELEMVVVRLFIMSA